MGMCLLYGCGDGRKPENQNYDILLSGEIMDWQIDEMIRIDEEARNKKPSKFKDKDGLEFLKEPMPPRSDPIPIPHKKTFR
jgi:hypothetical protein